MAILIGVLATVAVLGLILYVVGVLHIKGKIRVPGSPEIDRVTGVKRDEGGATVEDVR